MARGGKREGSGRKPIAEELKARDTFLKAIKEFYKKETCEEAQIQFIKETLMESQRGQIFFAEHIFGNTIEFFQHLKVYLKQLLYSVFHSYILLIF